jgi:hypothetical protein
MSSTWATRLANGDGSRLRFYITIQGIPYVFQTSSTALPSSVLSSTYTRFKGLDIPQQGGSRLDLPQRRMIGGSLSFSLTEDGSGTLAALFSPRVRRTTFVNGDASASTATIAVQSTASLPSAGTVYIGAETITHTSVGVGPTRLAGCTRGAFNSKAQPHKGDALSGAAVYESPPWWFGRRVYLYGYFENLDGTTSADLDSQLGTFSIEENPRYDADRNTWSINCSELIDEHFAKTLGKGLRSVTIEESPPPLLDHQGSTINLPLDTGSAALDRFVLGDTGSTTYALCGMSQGGYTMFRLNAVNADSIDLEVGNRIRRPTRGLTVVDVKHVALLEDTPAQCFLWAACSRLGDGTNGSFDVLPGRHRDFFAEDDWQFGAGIESTEVDSAAIASVGAIARPFCYPIFSEHAFSSLIREFAIVTGTFAYVTRAGKLSFKRIDADAASAFTVNDSTIVPATRPSIEFDEENIHPTVDLSANHDPIEDEFKLRIVLNDVELHERYANRVEPFSVEMRSLHVTVNPVLSLDSANGNTISVEWPYNSQPAVFDGVESVERSQVEHLLREEQMADGRGRAIVTATVNIGDPVTLSVDLPDLEGATSITSRRALVVGRQPNFRDATVELQMMLLEAKVWRIAPACIIQSEAGAVLTLRANSATFPEGSDSGNANMFPVGCSVRCWDVSAATSQTRTVDAVSGALLTLSSALTFGGGVESDVDFVTLDTQAAAGANSNNGYDVRDFAYQMPTDETTSDETTRHS